MLYKEITTEVGNFKIGAESTVIDDTENNSPVTKPVIISSLYICIATNEEFFLIQISIMSSVQTTVSYYDGPGQTTESSDSRLAFQV